MSGHLAIEGEPFWRAYEPAPEFDIALLRPPSLGRGERFETVADAQEYAATTCDRLSKIKTGSINQLRRRVESCRSGASGAACGRPICADCARDFRRWLTGETLRLISQDGRSCTVVTLFLQGANEDQLEAVHPSAFKDLVR